MTQTFVALIVGLLGLHMLVAALRHRALAETWIGLFFVATAVGAEAALRAIESPDPAFGARLMSIGATMLAVATMCGYAFIYTVFCRGERWAQAVVFAGSLLVAWGAWYQLSGPRGVADLSGLCVQLLADADGDVCRSYGVLREKEADGRNRTCILRSTFIIDRKGVLRHALYGVSPRGHAAEVLGLLREAGTKKCR